MLLNTTFLPGSSEKQRKGRHRGRALSLAVIEREARVAKWEVRGTSKITDLY